MPDTELITALQELVKRIDAHYAKLIDEAHTDYRANHLANIAAEKIAAVELVISFVKDFPKGD